MLHQPCMFSQDRDKPPVAIPKAALPAGFTLVELLVVIAVISLLISLLLPALSSARRRAKDATCLANIRQLGQAAMMYAIDNRQSCVPIVKDANNFNYTPLASENPVLGAQRWAYWADAMYPYLSYNIKAYQCALGSTRYGVTAPGGYATNPLLYPSDLNGARTSTRVLSIEEFRDPSDKFYFMDSGFSNFSDIASRLPQEHYSPYLLAYYIHSTANRATAAIRHNIASPPILQKNARPESEGGFNVAYFDGHGGFMQWKNAVPQYYNSGASAADKLMRDTYWKPTP